MPMIIITSLLFTGLWVFLKVGSCVRDNTHLMLRKLQEAKKKWGYSSTIQYSTHSTVA